ncbi:MAG: phytanoyl-CoA dioxygenase family protein [Pseudomonadota bacterium]
MDESCLHHRLTDAESRQFNEQGFLVVRDVLPTEMIETLVSAADRIDHEYRPKMALTPHQPLNLLDAIGKDDAFLPLLDWPQTFAKVVDILGWHIQLYHSHMIVTPPLPADFSPKHPRLGWHQDSGRLNIDIESNPRPRISLKVGFFLTDLNEIDRGNFHVIPGSHLDNTLSFPEADQDHPDATPVQVPAGDAVFFDRRIWHAAGRNLSSITRKVMFLGYSYRWLKPRDDMTVAHYLDRCDPVQKQLFGESPNGGFGFTSPADEDVPLKTWWAAHVGQDAVIP